MSSDALAWDVVEGPGPLCAVAIHDGHLLRPELAAHIALSDDARLREEDPHTGAWTVVAPNRLVARRSRFEVDLNRPRDRAVYLQPTDAWGLAVWRGELPADVVERSLAVYDAFYAAAKQVLDQLASRHARFVVLDLHTYNHRRGGPRAAYDAQSKHPDVNIGTGSLDRERWAPVIDRLITDLAGCEGLGRRLDVRENVKFFGGYFSRWVHATYREHACCPAIEFKKFFMDEWTGSLDADLHELILQLLRQCADGVLDVLGTMA